MLSQITRESKTKISTVNCGILLFNQGQILECTQRLRQDMHIDYYQLPKTLNPKIIMDLPVQRMTSHLKLHI